MTDLAERPWEDWLTIGTYEQARAMIGHRTSPEVAQFAISDFMVKSFCALVHDGHPAYWGGTDEDTPTHTAHPGLLQSYVLTLPWAPGVTQRRFPIHARVPLPGPSAVNAATSVQFFAPLRVGQLLSYTEELVDVSPEKTTALGVGHFVKTQVDFFVGEELVARQINTLFRYEATT